MLTRFKVLKSILRNQKVFQTKLYRIFNTTIEKHLKFFHLHITDFLP